MAALQLRTALAAYAGIFPPSAPPPTSEGLRRWWEERLREPPPAAGFVAELDGEVAGTVWVGAYPEDPGVGVLSRLYVAPELWGTGIGAALYDAAVRGLVDAGFAEAVLGVLERNERARRFYEQRGWAPEGTSYEAGKGTGVVELLYRVSLPRTSSV